MNAAGAISCQYVIIARAEQVPKLSEWQDEEILITSLVLGVLDTFFLIFLYIMYIFSELNLHLWKEQMKFSYA